MPDAMTITAMTMSRRAFASALPLALAATTARAQAPQAPADLPRPPLFGKPTAPRRFVVWGTYTCPFTAQLFQVLGTIVRDMPERVSIEWRHFPTHAVDPALHVAALGFKDRAFWQFSFAMMDVVLKAGGAYDGLTPDKILEFAKAAGGSEETLKAAYADKKKWEAVQQDLLAGRLMGVTLTPGLFFNGYFLTPEGIPHDKAAFDKSLREMVKA